MELDRIDARLLAELQRNNRVSSEELGELVGLSSTGIQRRLKRLRSSGIIEADIAVVSPKAVGRDVMMLVMVSLERERADIIDTFKHSIRSTPEIMSGYYVTGDADFVLVVTTRNMEEYEQFTRQFFYNNPNIKGFKTMVVMDRVKAGFSIPIPGAVEIK
ncbi:Lrp/AsnC family transcriptional regulator, leucine-responsive regulatory protein [Pseudomonas sp. NFACC02]|uniref:Lrp/AsnC family transcriptional regulator n=1 Tax=Pseudomonas TaxID=286 RepID=UPI0007853FE9|nr:MULTISPECIES: Lrp/AsnC family transcriptional regulator [Pseudomonas]SEQ01228.1 Lrp/AsnC family transcriptional regulator, leucine-responsive regulatory protein [Pseudomonas sp. NFACC02]